MMNVTLRQIDVFMFLARTQSFSRAAIELGLTQPAVSIHIRQLEQLVGLALFERSRHKVTLTEAGHKFLVHARNLQNLLRDAEQEMNALRGRRIGTLRLGTVDTAKYFSPSLVAAFNELNPDIAVQFSVDKMPEIAQQLSSNEIDLAISGRAVPGVDAHTEPFASHPYVIIASPRHPLARKRRIPLARLEAERFLTREPNSGTALLMAKVFGQEKVRFRSAMESNSNETIKQAVMAGMGISFLSMHTASLELTTGKLVALNIVGMPHISHWQIVYVRNKRLSPIAEAFRDFLLSQGQATIEQATSISSNNKIRTLKSRPVAA